ncbi:prephenate dehydrogenase [Ornithinimicrobium faecis]|uniref:Prephenate dehydrogenase/arogenate dehydrogenase family protein n=1 Tax=Ornithinimicrobium faecis TaxID=2934158 RepID=A0ABY4YR31_9MICO|nr:MULTISPECIES: prephenate dehydrogenase/arogenate dehydrogenase family protein [unclassified Ornithinimicrobium]USQ79041.1 prephenate dehydrogenase/arogenate dehydrogenase family protein [Ornithinimicrobium sp. HY1793]
MTQVPPQVNSCAVVGLGLIGGSFALRMLQLGVAVHGWDPDAETRTQAAAAGIQIAETISALPRTDLALLAGPTSTVVDQLRRGEVPQATVLIDACSAKGVIADAALGSGLTHLVPCHPMAGTEHSGFAAAQADLLTDAVWAITPVPGNDLESIHTALSTVVGAFESRAALISPQVHDEAVAAVSHVPHATGQALVRGVLRSAHPDLTAALAAGSFRDATRVLRGDVDKTVELLTQNRGAVLEQLAALTEDLNHLQSLLSDEQDDAVHDWFAHAPEVGAGERSLPLDSGADLAELLEAGAEGYLVTGLGAQLTLVRPTSS